MTAHIIPNFTQPVLVIFLFLGSLGSGDVINLPINHANAIIKKNKNSGLISSILNDDEEEAS